MKVKITRVQEFDFWRVDDNPVLLDDVVDSIFDTIGDEQNMGFETTDEKFNFTPGAIEKFEVVEVKE